MPEDPQDVTDHAGTGQPGGVRGWAHRQAAAYRNGTDQPVGGYLATVGVYALGVTAVAIAARMTGRRAPDKIAPWDVVLMATATHRISRTIAKDPVASPLRAPFATFEGRGAPAELSEQVRGSGLRHSTGELLTCPFCLAQWVATGLTAGLVFAPRPTRLVMTAFTAVAGADFLQHAYVLAQHTSS